MQFDHYLDEYLLFHAEFSPDATPEIKKAKLVEEIYEFLDAIEHGDRKDQLAEGIDVMNTVIAWLFSEGVTDPLHVGWEKLQATGAKYRESGIK